MSESLLKTTLQCAVLLRIFENARLTADELWDCFESRREYLIDMIASHGDDILFKSRREGDTAKAFNALAESLAFMAFVPGGVTFLGDHWEHPKPVLDRSVFGFMKKLIAASNIERVL